MASLIRRCLGRPALRAIAVAGLLLASGAGHLHAEALVIAVVVHPANQVKEMSRVELCDMLLGERTRWADGSPIRVLVPPVESPEWAVVVRAVCHTSVAGFRRQVAAGRPFGRASRPPQVAATAVEMKQAVAASPRAIGFLTAPQVDDTVRGLPIDGKAAADAGYPIQDPAK